MDKRYQILYFVMFLFSVVIYNYNKIVFLLHVLVVMFFL